MKNYKIAFWILVVTLILILISFSTLTIFNNWSCHSNSEGRHYMDMHEDNDEHSMNDIRNNFITMKDKIISKNMSDGNYTCCLEKPCTYCIEKTPGHGENSKCTCLEDVMNGKHPCGECIGEILEGHGNKYISKYFATSIAEEVGHLEIIKQIIFEKYGTLIEDQL